MGQDMLAKVRALRETADSYEASGNLEAAASYAAKAEKLMKQYRIDQEDVLAKDATAFEPVMTIIDVCRLGTPYRQQYINMMYRAASHVGSLITFDYLYSATGTRVNAKVVGYEDDNRYAEMLFTAAALVFTDRLEPKVDPKLSDQVNAYRLRAAGIERVRASEMLWGQRDPGKIGRLYLAECKVRGEAPALTGRGVTGAVYRQQYAEEFDYTFGRRLARARNAADSVGGGLVLHGREERVREAFYNFFPEMRPSTDVDTTIEPYQCPDCKEAKSGQCRACKAAERRLEAEVRRDQERRARHFHSAAGQAGRRSGAEAATYVELSRTDTAKRVGEGSPTSSKEIRS